MPVLGLRSYFSVQRVIASISMRSCFAVVSLWVFVIVCVMASVMAGMISCLCFLYVAGVNVFLFWLILWGIVVSKIVSVARWSASGGETVPAVVGEVMFVRTTSMLVSEWCTGSNLVGVVIQLVRLF